MKQLNKYLTSYGFKEDSSGIPETIEEQQDFINRLTKLFNKDFEKGELNDRCQIIEQLSEELKDY